MGFDVKDKLLLVLLAFAVGGYFVYQATRLYRLYPRRKYLVWASLRTMTVVCLILAAAGFTVTRPGNDVATIFLVDRSLSADSHAQEIEAWINRQISDYKERNDRIGVVSFAREPMLEVPLTGEEKEVRLAAAPDPNFTNIQKALEYCRNLFPGDAQKRLVLITDGCENLGSAATTLRKMGEWGINLAVYPLAASSLQDVQLTAMHAPAGIHKGEAFSINVEIDSTYAGAGSLTLFCGTRKVKEQTVAVNKGTTRLLYQMALNGDDGTEIKGEISFPGDENVHNNSFTISLPVKNSPRILLAGESSARKNLATLLTRLGFSFQSCPIGEVPVEPGLLSTFDQVILANVPHASLPAGFEAALEQCVREQGLGLVVVGGDSSFAPGGYENTIFEKMLPVSCRMKGNEKIPNTGLVLVMDCSGSMNDESAGVRKLEMVKEAALKSMAALGQEDRLGVLAFSDVQEWVVPVGAVRLDDTIKDRIGRLEPGGGTLIMPALARALEALEQEDVRVKHMILLTDGQAEKEGFDAILNKTGEAGITLSTVAVGTDADRSLLEHLADAGGGRSYYTDRYQDIPDIFAKETYLATKMYLNSRRFALRQNTDGSFPQNAGLPDLLGYTGTGLREGADLVLASDSGDPLLAFQQYGLGMVAVWTSDLSGQWSRPWIQWNGFQNYWGMVLNKCLAANDQEDGLDINITQRGCGVGISVGIEGFENGQSMEARLYCPDGGEKDIPLQQALPGVFEGEMELDWPGSYGIRFVLTKDGVVLRHVRRTVHLDCSPEYSIARAANSNLQAGAFGKLVVGSMDLFSLPLERKCAIASPVGPLLMILALLAFIAEIGVRKLM